MVASASSVSRLSGEISASGWSLFGKTLVGKKPFLGSFVLGKPVVVLGKTCLLFGAYRGKSPFLAIYSLPVFGRYLRLWEKA